jgi:hypothetical protein
MPVTLLLPIDENSEEYSDKRLEMTVTLFLPIDENSEE